VDVFLALEVKHDGAIQFCGQDSRGLSDHTIGHFGQISLFEAWNGSIMEAKRDQVGRALGHEASPVCRNCYHNTDKYDLFKKGPEKSRSENEPDAAPPSSQELSAGPCPDGPGPAAGGA
jgi:hypothetical protein